MTTVDGTPTFLTGSSNNNTAELTGQIRKKSRTDLQSLGEREQSVLITVNNEANNELTKQRPLSAANSWIEWKIMLPKIKMHLNPNAAGY